MNIYDKLKNCLCGNYQGGAKEETDVIKLIKEDKEEIMKEYDKIKGLSQEDLIQKIIQLERLASQKDKELETARKDALKEKKEKEKAEKALEGALAEKKGELMVRKDIDNFNLLNLYRFFNKYDEGLLYHPDEDKRKRDDDGNFIIDRALYAYDPFLSAYDKNIENYRPHQKRFIADWSVSVQELVIMYYGVGTGKTLIAITCAEEYLRLNKNSYVYFLMPSSLVLNTILEMFKFGIDPTITDEDGNNRYIFISYAQLLRTKFNFRDNSLLIVDEIHNLRNLKSQEINDKVSARKWKPTGNYSLVGSVLANQLLDNSHNFIRKVFMTGTLFVNSSEDLEPVMAIGYNKRPLLKMDKEEYYAMIKSDVAFKNYYEGLVSFYRISGDEKKRMPTAIYHFPIADYEDLRTAKSNIDKDPYFINSRNLGTKYKIGWIIDFIQKNKNDKTLIYTQFLDRSLKPLTKSLEFMGIPYATISGQLSQEEKMEVVGRYNRDEVKILIFTLAIKEGISFKETNNFIVYNPYWNYAILEQIIARGIRLNSHKQGYKSTINVYLLCVASIKDKGYTPQEKRRYKDALEWSELAEDIMNNDIKTLKYNKDNDGNLLSPFYEDFASRDINLYNRMFNKQAEINDFESRILKLPSFEEVNNNENSEFLKTYNQALLDYQQANGKLPPNKQMIELKRRLYKEFYDETVKETNKNIKRFSSDTNYKTTRNPDLEEIADFTDYPNLENDIRTLIKKGASLDKIFEKFKIDKTIITTFQANFTPLEHIRKLLELCKLEDDPNNKIKILEGTAGIGNVVSGLMELKNKQNFMIDCNELNKVFYQIGKVLYEDLDNVFWYNADFMGFVAKYNYDYIIGNPPFNLRTKLLGRDTTLYDIDFVEKAYNMLRDDGTLAFIISSRFQRDEKQHFKNFNTYLEEMKKVDENNVIIEPLDTGFKKDKGLAKEMETSYGMVYIILKKLPNYFMNLKKPLNAVYNTEERINLIRDDKAEKDKIRTEKKLKKTQKKDNEGIEEDEEENETQPKVRRQTKAQKKKEIDDKIRKSIQEDDKGEKMVDIQGILKNNTAEEATKILEKRLLGIDRNEIKDPNRKKSYMEEVKEKEEEEKKAREAVEKKTKAISKIKDALKVKKAKAELDKLKEEKKKAEKALKTVPIEDTEWYKAKMRYFGDLLDLNIEKNTKNYVKRGMSKELKAQIKKQVIASITPKIQEKIDEFIKDAKKNPDKYKEEYEEEKRINKETLSNIGTMEWKIK